MKAYPKDRNLYFIYYILGSISLIVVLISLLINHRLITIFDHTVKDNREWITITQKFSKLAGAVQQINAPANDVFESLKFDLEEHRMVESYSDFEAIYMDLLDDIQSMEPADDKHLSRALNEIYQKTVLMKAEEEGLMADLKNGRRDLAGAHMARVDFLFRDILRAMRVTDHYFDQVQFLNLAAQNERSKATAGAEYGVGLAVILLMIGTTLYGWWLTQKLNEYSKIIEEERQRVVYAGKMAALGEMAGGIAHEINNPLAVIQVRADQLKALAGKGELKMADVELIAERIEATCQRIAKIIRGLISFSRGGGEGEPMQAVTVERIFEETLSMCMERFKKHGVKLEFSVHPPGLQIVCRPIQIQQVLLNLLNNSFDAISELPERWVFIRAQKIAENVEITVEDSGPGIPAELREKIMLPFYTTKGIGRGTGLGLSISKGIIETHDGAIRLDENSQHTRFVITLPLTPNGKQKNSTTSFSSV